MLASVKLLGFSTPVCRFPVELRAISSGRSAGGKRDVGAVRCPDGFKIGTFGGESRLRTPSNVQNPYMTDLISTSACGQSAAIRREPDTPTPPLNHRHHFAVTIHRHDSLPTRCVAWKIR